MSKAILICGKICSGKSTYAEKIRKQNKAVILSCDEIMLALYGNNSGDNHDKHLEQIKKHLYAKALEILEIGIDIIFDWGFWTRAERESAKKFFAQHGYDCELHYVDVSENDLHININERNKKIMNRELAYYVDDKLAEKCNAVFEQSDNNEIDVRYENRRTNENDISTSFTPKVHRLSSPNEKISLYRSLFRGREDVYAQRWVNTKTGKSGYSPVCANKWAIGICDMSKVKCPSCPNRSLEPLTDSAIFRHLSGKDELCRDVIGIYPLLSDETVYFLAIDFDEADWKNDVTAVREICRKYEICAATERSRSGNGAHLWIFFDEPISAADARKLGSGLLTQAMKIRHELKFSSYDRMFPNQDTMPSGGFGNLIALPLQKQAVKKGNSVFVDENFDPYPDQWVYLSTIERLDQNSVDDLIIRLGEKSELGELFEEVQTIEPWETKPLITDNVFPDKLQIISENMLYIPKSDLSQQVLNQIKRLAAFKNPDFYKAQAMRMSTYDKPRIISLAQSDDKYMMIPRGCYDKLQELAQQNNCILSVIDKRNPGRPIKVTFNGVLRPEQNEAIEAILSHETGVLAATTAFGKTVTAAAIIAERKVNTLILVHTQALLEQWKKSLTHFLIIDESIPEPPIKRGRRKKLSIIGQLGGNKNELHGIIDIAVIQSLYHENEVKDFVKNYGMVIVDECHHVSALSFEAVLREVTAKFVYGLTATPKRSDGHQPIIFMQCGNIRYTAKAFDYAKKHSFSHILVPRFTKYRSASENMTITEHYKALSESEYRNALIVQDVINAIKTGRNPIIISERMSHLEILYDMLKGSADHVIILSGKGTAKVKRELLDRIKSISPEQSIILLATGKYVGEGFDEPRIDTLFLTLPISWSGTLSQYAGRLHRECHGKSSVMIYDYVDIHVPMIENMYKRRLRGYASLGYTLQANDNNDDYRTIYTDNFEKDLIRDISSASISVTISASYITSSKLNLLLKLSSEAKLRNIQFKIILKNSKSDYMAKIINLLDSYDVEYSLKNKLSSSAVIIDGKFVWYSSGELFYHSNEECVLRIHDEVFAGELLESLK